jgi:hypothetical protein
MNFVVITCFVAGLLIVTYIIYLNTQIWILQDLVNYYRQPGTEITISEDEGLKIITEPACLTLSWCSELGRLTVLSVDKLYIEVYAAHEKSEWIKMLRMSPIKFEYSFDEYIGSKTLLAKIRVKDSYLPRLR